MVDYFNNTKISNFNETCMFCALILASDACNVPYIIGKVVQMLQSCFGFDMPDDYQKT